MKWYLQTMHVALFASISLAATVALAQEDMGRDASAPACRSWEFGERVANLNDRDVDESSGLALSRRTAGVFWTHNDSGGEPRLFAFTDDGTVFARVTLNGAEAVDWEDMAIGPCAPGDETPCIYVGDFGDNNAERETVVIFRFPEPTVDPSSPADETIDDFDTIRFEYPPGPRNSETLLVHPETAAMYVIDKTTDELDRVWRIPAVTSETTMAEEVGEVRLDEGSFLANQITAGDIAPDGREVTIRTYLGIYTYCAADGADFESAFASPPTHVEPLAVLQGEALAYSRDGDTLWITSEKIPTPLIRLPSTTPRNVDSADAGSNSDDADAGTRTATDAAGDARPDEGAPTEDAARAAENTGPDCACNLPGRRAGGAAPWLAALLALLAVAPFRRRSRFCSSRAQNDSAD